MASSDKFIKENERKVAALGRTFHVGQLYDARQEIILAQSLWDPKTVNENKQCFVHSGNDYACIADDTQSNKATHLDIDANLQLSFCAGLIQVGGSAKFLQDTKSSEHISRISLKFYSTQRYEEISSSVLHQVEFGDILKQPQLQATHVVTRVIYGYNAFFVFDRRVDENENMKKVHGEMKAVIKRIPGLVADGNISGNLSDEEKNETSKFSCKFYGDFTPEYVPTTFEEAVKICHDIPKLLGISGIIDPKSEIGKPLIVYLTPVSSLKGVQDVPQIMSIDGSARVQVPFLMQYLTDVSTEVNDLVSSAAYSRFENLNNEVTSFQRAVNSFKEEVKGHLKALIPAIRSGDKKESDLVQYLKDIENSPFGTEMLKSYLQRKKKELSILAQTLKNMDISSKENIVEVFPGSSTDLSTLLVDTKYEFVYCFIFNVKASKPLQYIENMKKYLTDFMNDKIDPNEVFAPPEDDKEWFDDLHVISKFRTLPSRFLDLAAACCNCSETKSTIFAVTNVHQEVAPGDPVTLQYVGGELVSKDFTNTLEKIKEPEYQCYTTFKYIESGGGSTEQKTILWNPFPQIRKYIVWYDEDKGKIENRTARNMPIFFTDKDAKDILMAGNISTQLDVNFHGYLCVSAIWEEYGLVTDSPIIHTT